MGDVKPRSVEFDILSLVLLTPDHVITFLFFCLVVFGTQGFLRLDFVGDVFFFRAECKILCHGNLSGTFLLVLACNESEVLFFSLLIRV